MNPGPRAGPRPLLPASLALALSEVTVSSQPRLLQDTLFKNLPVCHLNFSINAHPHHSGCSLGTTSECLWSAPWVPCNCQRPSSSAGLCVASEALTLPPWATEGSPSRRLRIACDDFPVELIIREEFFLLGVLYEENYVPIKFPLLFMPPGN